MAQPLRAQTINRTPRNKKNKEKERRRVRRFLSDLGSTIIVLNADDIILTEIAPRLNFD